MLLHPINENDDKKIKTTELEEGIDAITEESKVIIKEENKAIIKEENKVIIKEEDNSEDDDSIDLDEI